MEFTKAMTMAFENEGMEFECEIRAGISDIMKVIGGILYFFRGSKCMSTCMVTRERSKLDWKPVSKEAKWQEAIQAWLNGGEFRIEFDNYVYSQIKNARLGVMELKTSGSKTILSVVDGFYSELFTKGKWYIT